MAILLALDVFPRGGGGVSLVVADGPTLSPGPGSAVFLGAYVSAVVAELGPEPNPRLGSLLWPTPLVCFCSCCWQLSAEQALMMA